MRLIKRLPTRNVYISVDKDCLVKEEALTNWEEGCLSLEQLLLGLRLIRQNLNVLGVDICGDYSRVQIASRVKSSLSFIDHPKRVPADRLCLEEITAVNETTNLKILEALL
jgi:hypothetical protein